MKPIIELMINPIKMPVPIPHKLSPITLEHSFLVNQKLIIIAGHILKGVNTIRDIAGDNTINRIESILLSISLA